MAFHVLERVDYPAVTFRFEHQQFQEHYVAVGIHAKLLELTDATRVRGWSDEARADFVSEVLHQRLVPEIVAFAIADPSMKVKQAAVSSLDWTGAGDEAALVLESMEGDAFSQAAREVSPERLPTEVRPKIVAALHKLLDTAADPWDRLRSVTKLIELGEPGLDERFEKILGGHSNRRSARARALSHPTDAGAPAVARRWISEWLASRIADGGLWPDI